MLHGLMMDTQLTTNSIMSFADKVYPESEIVSITADQGLHRYTYADAFKRTRQLANALSHEGLEQGDRIATLAWNDYRHFELYYATSGSGYVCHTINPRLFPEQIHYIIDHAEDKLLFTDPMFLPLLEKLAPSLQSIKKIIVLTDDAHLPETSLSNLCSYESYIADQATDFQWPELDEKSASSLCYTSGTTGNPKGVLYSHRSTVIHAYGGALPDSMNLSVRDTVLPIVPMFHAHAWSIPYAGTMVGLKFVFPGPKMGDGETLYNLIESEQVTVSAGVPTVLLALLGYLKETGQTLSHLDRFVVGGAACPISLITAFREQHNVEVITAWGLTETSPVGTMNSLKPGMKDLPQDELDKILIKQGRPVFGVDLEIIGSDGKQQPWDGESAGEVVLRGPWICSGYYKLDTNDAHEREGWFKTGDIATMDTNGYMQITDRVKDVIKSGGEWISSIDLENAAVGHPDIKEAAVIGVPHPKWTERPLLIVVKEPNTNIEASDLLASLKGKVADWWIPDEVVFVDELPHTATGKISKKDLRDQFKDFRFTNA